MTDSSTVGIMTDSSKVGRQPSTRMYVGQTFPRGDSVSREFEGRAPPDGGKHNILVVFVYRPFAVSAMAVRCVQV